MTGWRVDPASARSVLTNVGVEVEGMAGHVTSRARGNAVELAVWDVPVMRDVRDAVEELLESQAGDVAAIRERLDAGCAGVARAVDALDAGQVQMAEAFQLQMVLSVPVGGTSGAGGAAGVSW